MSGYRYKKYQYRFFQILGTGTEMFGSIQVGYRYWKQNSKNTDTETQNFIPIWYKWFDSDTKSIPIPVLFIPLTNKLYLIYWNNFILLIVTRDNKLIKYTVKHVFLQATVKKNYVV